MLCRYTCSAINLLPLSDPKFPRENYIFQKCSNLRITLHIKIILLISWFYNTLLCCSSGERELGTFVSAWAFFLSLWLTSSLALISLAKIDNPSFLLIYSSLYLLFCVLFLIMFKNMHEVAIPHQGVPCRPNDWAEIPPSWQSKVTVQPVLNFALADTANDLSMPCHEQLTGAIFCHRLYNSRYKCFLCEIIGLSLLLLAYLIN